ncbi:MAG: dihydroorotate dehydrogenase [Patescibacteria group bacterium]
MGIQMRIDDIRIMNAAGIVKVVSDVEPLLKTPVTDVVLGSITMIERQGEPEPTFWVSDDGSFALNRVGLRNPGSEYYRKHLPEIGRKVRDAGKELTVSLAGFSIGEYVSLAEIALEGGADAIELNLGCPNVWDGDSAEQKIIPSFDPDFLEQTVVNVWNYTQDLVPLSLKLSPYSDPGLLRRVAKSPIMNEIVDAVVATNTLPNGIAYWGGKPVISGNGLAGVSGKVLKPVALGQVAQLRAALPGRVRVVGVGGISCGADVRDMVRAGAAAVQVGTHFFQYGPKVFGEILSEALVEEVVV